MKKNHVRRGFAARSRTKKAIALAGLAVFMALTIGITWTFWQAGVMAPSENNATATVQIGSAGDPVDTVIALSSFNTMGTLIPQGVHETNSVAENDGDVHYVVGVIKVDWLAEGESSADPAQDLINQELLRLRRGTLTVAPQNALQNMEDPITPVPLELNINSNAFRFRNRNAPTSVAPSGPNAPTARYHNMYHDGDWQTLANVDLFEVDLFYTSVASAVATTPSYTAITGGASDFYPLEAGVEIAGMGEIWIVVVIRMNIPLNHTDYGIVAGAEVGFGFNFNITVIDL